MEQTERSGRYVVTVWDYDSAPDAVEWREGSADEDIAPYYVYARRRFPMKRDAMAYSREMMGELFMSGAAIDDAETGQEVESFGVTFPRSSL